MRVEVNSSSENVKTQAYYDTETIIAVESFIGQASGVI
jgi:hypothetical protein